jgi:hypothetical protein
VRAVNTGPPVENMGVVPLSVVKVYGSVAGAGGHVCPCGQATLIY